MPFFSRADAEHIPFPSNTRNVHSTAHTYIRLNIPAQGLNTVLDRIKSKR